MDQNRPYTQAGLRLGLLCAVCFPLILAGSPDKLASTGMKSYQESSFVIHHRDESLDTLQDLVQILELAKARAEDFFGRAVDTTNVYIYPDHRSFRTRKYGFVGNLLSLNWYIGDNIGPQMLLLSPDKPTSHHSRTSILRAAGHELVHTVVYRLYPDCPLWLNEGVALYLTNGRRDISRFSTRDIPPIRIFTSRNPLYFARHKGYSFADKYIAYVLERHGKEALFALMSGLPYNQALGTSKADSYAGWLGWLEDFLGRPGSD